MFLIIEGTDGAGKGTVIEIVKIKGFEHRICYEREIKIFQHFFEYNKFKSDTVMDRYHMSEVVYGNSMRGQNYDIRELEKQIFGDDINKVALVLVDIDPETAYKRVLERDGVKEKQDLFRDRNLFFEQFYESTIKNKIVVHNSDITATESILVDFIDKIRKEA